MENKNAKNYTAVKRGLDRFHRSPRRSRLRRCWTYKSARVFPSYQHCKLKIRQAEERRASLTTRKEKGGKRFIGDREPRAEINTTEPNFVSWVDIYNRPLFLYGK